MHTSSSRAYRLPIPPGSRIDHGFAVPVAPLPEERAKRIPLAGAVFLELELARDVDLLRCHAGLEIFSGEIGTSHGYSRLLRIGPDGPCDDDVKIASVVPWNSEGIVPE
jgi:hypothetical protein